MFQNMLSGTFLFLALKGEITDGKSVYRNRTQANRLQKGKW